MEKVCMGLNKINADHCNGQVVQQILKQLMAQSEQVDSKLCNIRPAGSADLLWFLNRGEVAFFIDFE